MAADRQSARQIDRLDTIDAVYAFWSRNSAAFGKLSIGAEEADTTAPQLAEALKERARQVGQPQHSNLQWRDKRSNFCRRAGGRILSDPKGEAVPRSGASRFRCQPAVFDLRPAAGASASPPLRAAARHGDEGL